MKVCMLGDAQHVEEVNRQLMMHLKMYLFIC
jgi:hypothetical protein